MPWACTGLVEERCAQGAVTLVGSWLVKSGRIKGRSIYTVCNLSTIILGE